MQLSVTHIDTACILLEINGFHIITDPVLDRAGKLYHFGFGAVSRKTGDPALAASALPPIDLCLLSHHQHQDNLDAAGRALLPQIPLTLSTPSAAKALKINIIGLQPWASHTVTLPDGSALKITATPAQHRPFWLPEFFSGQVIGFVLEHPGFAHGAVWISGDTVFFPGIGEIGRRFRIGTAFLHLGGVQFPYLSGLGRYTFHSKGALKAIEAIQPQTVIPIHFKGWTHFREREERARAAFAGALAQVIWPEAGREFQVEV